MSGGSWNYLYSRMEEAACDLVSSGDPLRRAFGERMMLFAKAMHDIEWVDSGDYGDDGDVKSMQEALKACGSDPSMLAKAAAWDSLGEMVAAVKAKR